MIRKALITAAGFGTRFLPITKTVQKEMLPILNRPLVDYVVEDCIKAGIEEIIFIISEHNMQLIHFYRENNRLEKYLDDMGKSHLYEHVRHLHEQATFTFIRQPDAEQYGTAVPVKLAREKLANEDAFLVFMGDDFIYNRSGDSEAAQMIEAYERTAAGGLVTCIQKPEEELHRYGIAKLRQSNGHQYLDTLVEKPAPGTAPSRLANISKYILTPAIFDIIDTQELNEHSGELYITDSVTTLAQDEHVAVYTPTGEYLDGGNVAGWLKANLTLARDDEELSEVVRTFCKRNYG